VWGAGVTRRQLLARAAQAGVLATAARPLAWPYPAGAAPPAMDLWALGGELQYFRSDPAHLEQRLAACAQAGYTTIQTYVAWNVHENERGALDFTGRTRPVIVNDHADQWQEETPDDQVRHGGLGQVVVNTDLAGYLRTLARHGFRVILRPGPFISDEWRNGGIPDWLLNAGYPDMFMRGPDGTPVFPGFPLSTPPAASVTGGGPLFYFPGPSYGSDLYLGEVRRWLTAFASFVKPWLATSGGPVVAVQVDDEICFYYRFGPFEADYHPAMVARYRAETGEDPPRELPPAGRPVRALAPTFAWQRFKGRQLGVYLGTLAADLRAAGVDVPITHEEELQLSPPASLADIASAVDVLNPEFYNGSPAPWTLPLDELDASAARAAQRHLREPIGAEMGADPLLYTVLVGEGIAGGLVFTYTDGVPDDAIAPLGLLGRTIRTAGTRLAHVNRRADTAVVWTPELTYAPYGSDRYGFSYDVRRVIERDVPALATLLIRAGLAFDLLDTDAASSDDYTAYPTIWLVGADLLPRRTQADLVRYVEAGGRLICWPAPPTLDESLEPCTLLAEALYPERRAAFHGEDVQHIEAFGQRVDVFRGVQTFRLSRGAEAVATRDGEPCGYARPYGSGEALLLGTWPAADSVPGRAGVILDVQQVPAGGNASPMAATLAKRHLDVVIDDDLSRAGAGQPQYVVVYYYSNERRGGEVVTGGAVAYWDGMNVVPVVEVNSAAGAVRGTPLPEGAAVTVPPFRPVTPAHMALARAVHGRPPIAAAEDERVQARLLDARDVPGATIVAINRYPSDVETVIHARDVRLPSRGTLRLPAESGLLMPLGWQLDGGVEVIASTAQILGYAPGRRTATLDMLAPAGGELIVSVRGRLASVLVNGRPAAVGANGRVDLPPGQPRVQLAW
jgi:beta-galactosidase